MLLKKQIKSKKRVNDYGEVFTADKEVNAMLDLVNDEIEKIDSTVLEPACGEGAFILKIFERKMNIVKQYSWNGWIKEFMILRAVSGIYGVDIQKDNVMICRKKLFIKAQSYITNPTNGFTKMLHELIERNIICGNTISASTISNKPLIFNEWFFKTNGEILRKQVKYTDLLENDGECNSNKRSFKYDWMMKEKCNISNSIVLVKEVSND